MVELPKETHTFGKRFSRDVHGILATPRQAVKVIISETDLPHSMSVPLAVVVTAALLTVFGKYLVSDITNTVFGGPLWLQVIRSVLQGLALTVELFVVPIILIFMWITWSIVFHLLGSVVASSDITSGKMFKRTIKLTGFMFAPLFLNLLPLFPVTALYIMPVVTGFWSAWVAYIAMRENYQATKGGALFITFPYIFFVFYAALKFALSLLG